MMEDQKMMQPPVTKETKEPQALIEQVHSGLQELLPLVQAEAPQQAQKLQAMIGQYEQLVAEIAQGGAPEAHGKEPGQVAPQAGAGGVPVGPGGAYER